ncbi:MAG: murein tripeptide amidase MpaA [Planctomycetota bacterium]
MLWMLLSAGLLLPACSTPHAIVERARTPTDTRDVPALIWREFAVSVSGRPIRAATFGRGPRRVLWIGGIHGDEREGEIATREILSAAGAVRAARERVTLTVVHDLNPDGTAMNVRGNANGVDLNRNFPAENFRGERRFGFEPLSQPESKAVHDWIVREKPHLVIVLHSWRNARFVNYDGPARHLAERFSELSSYEVRSSSDLASTPGSLGSFVGGSLRRPILTVEFERGRDPRAAWEETRAAFLAVIFES